MMIEAESYEILEWVCVVDESMYDKVAWFRLDGPDTKLKELRLYTDRVQLHYLPPKNDKGYHFAYPLHKLIKYKIMSVNTSEFFEN
jgi:hypothetical protein